jgi:hypothetical protein
MSVQPQERSIPTAGIVGFAAFVGSIFAGMIVYGQGYGAGGGGVGPMLLGVGISAIGCLASFILAIASIFRKETPLFFGFTVLLLPVITVFLVLTGTIRL